MVGEHIRALKSGRWNHAIDCGDETVIHLAEDGLSPGAPRVRRSYRPEFVSGADVVEIVTHRERTFPAGEVVARAYSRISESALGAMFRDSEAFAEWCTTGRLPAPPNVALAVPAALPVNAAAAVLAAPAEPSTNAAEAKPATAIPAKAKPAKRASPKRAAKPAAKRGASARRTKTPARAPARPARKAAKRRSKKRR